MRLFIFATVVTLISANAFATERAFRINLGSTSDAGYAIGWGIKGENIDFEKIEAGGDQSVNDFLMNKSEKAVNFLVDLETESIVSEISDSDGMTSGHIGGIHLGNHYNLSLTQVSPKSDVYDADTVVMFQIYKWSNALSNIYTLRRSLGKVELISECKDCGDLMMKQIEAMLSPANRKLFNDRAREVSVSQNPKKPVGQVDFEIELSVPKGDEPVVVLNGTVEMTVRTGKTSVKVLSVRRTK